MAKKKRDPRAIRTQRFIEAHPNHPASKLWLAAAEAGVPLSCVAEAGGVSRYSIYLWAAGDVEPRPAQVTVIRRLTDAMNTAVKEGTLPLMTPGATAEDKVAAITRYL